MTTNFRVKFKDEEQHKRYESLNDLIFNNYSDKQGGKIGTIEASQHAYNLTALQAFKSKVYKQKDLDYPTILQDAADKIKDLTLLDDCDLTKEQSEELEAIVDKAVEILIEENNLDTLNKEI